MEYIVKGQITVWDDPNSKVVTTSGELTYLAWCEREVQRCRHHVSPLVLKEGTGRNAGRISLCKTKHTQNHAQ